MTRSASAVAKGRPAPVCFITAGYDGIASDPDAPVDAPIANV